MTIVSCSKNIFTAAAAQHTIASNDSDRYSNSTKRC